MKAKLLIHSPNFHSVLPSALWFALCFVVFKYYKHNRMRSFLRQLNQYSFAKQPIDLTFTSFSHPRFLRDRKDLLMQVQRRAPGEPAVTAESFGGEVHSSEVVEEGNTHPQQAKTSQHQKSMVIAPFTMAVGLVNEGALTRASSRRAKRCNASPRHEEFAASSSDRRYPAMVRTSGRIVHGTAKTRASAASNEDSSEVDGSKEEGRKQNELVADSYSAVLQTVAIKENEEFDMAGILADTKSLRKRLEAPEGDVSGSSTRPVGCALQFVSSDNPLNTADAVTLEGKCRSDGASALSDYSDLFLGSSVDFVLPFPELSEWGGGAFDLDDAFMPDLEPVREYSGGGGAEMKPCVLSQRTGDNTASPQWQAQAEMMYQQIPLT